MTCTSVPSCRVFSAPLEVCLFLLCLSSILPTLTSAQANQCTHVSDTSHFLPKQLLHFYGAMNYLPTGGDQTLGPTELEWHQGWW